jgi:hypothetical protein
VLAIIFSPTVDIDFKDKKDKTKVSYKWWGPKELTAFTGNLLAI